MEKYLRSVHKDYLSRLDTRNAAAAAPDAQATSRPQRAPRRASAK
jgi:hypothetical protein